MKKTGFILTIVALFSFILHGQKLHSQNNLQFSKYFMDSTLFLNYIHHGKAEMESVQIVELKMNSKWAGSIIKLTEDFDYGNFKVVVEDEESGKTIYSKGFSTLHNEWVNTEMAQKQYREFEETIKIPYPKYPVSIKIYSRDTILQFNVLAKYKFDPVIEKPIKIEEQYKSRFFQYSGDCHNKIDLVILPDGYKSNQKSLFYKDSKRLVKELFSYEPFNQYKERFNIVLIEAWSEESGTDLPHINKYANTLLNSSFNILGSERYLMVENFWKLNDLAASVPFDQIIVLVNTKEYGGGGIYNFYATCAAGNNNSGFVFCHEFGHSFAGLADEYSGNSTSVFDYKKLIEPWEPNITTLVNFNLKWADMVLPTTPVPTPDNLSLSNPELLGAFEGGAYLTKNVYRPRQDCTMRSISKNNFCPVCQKSIIKMINYYTQ